MSMTKLMIQPTTFLILMEQEMSITVTTMMMETELEPLMKTTTETRILRMTIRMTTVRLIIWTIPMIQMIPIPMGMVYRTILILTMTTTASWIQ